MIPFSYSLDTNIGKVRLLITDTDINDYLFNDAEIQSFLDQVGAIPELAAARAYGTIIRSRGLLAQTVRREGYSTTEHALSSLRELQRDLIADYERGAGGLQTSEIALDDSHFETHRPEWKDIRDPRDNNY
jgi:hypothetical protein